MEYTANGTQPYTCTTLQFPFIFSNELVSFTLQATYPGRCSQLAPSIPPAEFCGCKPQSPSFNYSNIHKFKVILPSTIVCKDLNVIPQGLSRICLTFPKVRLKNSNIPIRKTTPTLMEPKFATSYKGTRMYVSIKIIENKMKAR
jgi:hypothetical protein